MCGLSCVSLPCEADSRGLVSCWGPFPGPPGPSGVRTVSLDMRQSCFWDTHSRRRSSSFPSALKPMSHHQLKTQSNTVSTSDSRLLIHTARKVTSTCSKNLVEISFSRFLHKLAERLHVQFPHSPFSLSKKASSEVLFIAKADILFIKNDLPFKHDNSLASNVTYSHPPFLPATLSQEEKTKKGWKRSDQKLF